MSTLRELKAAKAKEDAFKIAEQQAHDEFMAAEAEQKEIQRQADIAALATAELFKKAQGNAKLQAAAKEAKKKDELLKA